MIKSLTKKDIFLSLYFGIITFMLSFFAMSCRMLEKDGDIIWNRAQTLTTCGISFAIGIVASFMTVFILYRISKANGKKSEVKCEIKEKGMAVINATEGKLPKWIWLGLAAILVCWLPAFLAFYPGLCNYDAEGYFFQFVYGPYNNHHPICYTLIIKLFYDWGKNVFGSYYVGIALFTITQMLLLAMSVFYFICTVYRFFPKKRLFIILTAVFALYPMNGYMAVTMTKDIFFAAGMICSFAAFARIMLKSDNVWKPSIHDFVNLTGLIFVILFRSNGRYCVVAVIMMELLFLIFYKMRRKTVGRIIVFSVAALFLGMLMLKVIDKATNAQAVDKREMLSVPGQQIARVVHFHEEELDEATMEQITAVIWPSSLYLYNQRTARFVKQDIISYEVKNHPKKYINLYISLFKDYPGDYLNAVLGMYSGFLSPFDRSHVLINEEDGVLKDGFHYIQTAFTVTERFNISQKPVSEFLYKAYTGYANSDGYLAIPVISLLFVPGTFLWIWLYSLGILIYQKKYGMILPYVLVFTYYLTFFLGPTVQLRYIYPIILCTPGLILLTLYKRTK